MAIFPILAKLVFSAGLLYGYYYLFLRNKRFHQYNRFYLLAIALLSVVIPFINIPVDLLWGSQQHSGLIQTLRVINANGWEEPVTVYARNGYWAKWLTVQNGLYFIYMAGVATSLFILLQSLAWIGRLKKSYPFETIERLSIYHTEEPGTPFSFFRSIFWDKKISLHNPHGQQIFRHEMFHVTQKHSVDVLLMEILCTACWFNPFFHLIKKEVKAIHEFLADEYAVSGNNRYDYAELLVSQAITQKKVQLTNPFFHNQIKRRIIMITQSNLIRRSGYISRIMALPVLFLLVSAFAVKLTHQPSQNTNHMYSNKTTTVVIDAGHGGIFPGANNIGMAEKDINLEISQEIKQLGSEYNVNIVLTRNDDKLVGNASNLREDLLNRVKISDEAKPDLFISIHVNQAYNKDQSIQVNTLHTGFEAYISRRQEAPKAKQFASAVLGELKNIYPVEETIRQRDEGIVVIDRTAYPCILLECGYLNNPKDLAFITNKDNQEKIARKILEGIVKYSNATVSAGGSVINLVAEKIQGDTISAQAVSLLNAGDVQSVNADMTKTTGTIYFKNGDTKYFNIKEVNDYYIVHKMEESLKNYRAGVNMQDAEVEITYPKDTVPAGSKTPLTKVEFEADYPGGAKGWVAYLAKTLKYPPVAQKKKIEGTVLLEFIVNADGKITDVKAISGPEELKAESIRTIQQSGVWVPAQDHGVKVKAYKKQPITFKLG